MERNHDEGIMQVEENMMCRLKYDIYGKLVNTANRSVLESVVKEMMDLAKFPFLCGEEERTLFWRFPSQKS